MTKVIERRRFAFKKGEIIHLDHFLAVGAFVQVDGRTKPYRSKNISRSQWSPDLSDEHKVLKDFTIEVIVRTGVEFQNSEK